MWSRATSPAGAGCGGADVESGFLAASVGLAVEDEFIRGGLEPVDGGLGEQGVGHLAEPFDRLAVGGDDGRRGPVAFDDELVDVRGVERVEGLEGEVVDLSRRRDSSTYADTATIPTRWRRDDLTLRRPAAGCWDSRGGFSLPGSGCVASAGRR